MTSETPVSNAVYQYYFENNHFSKDIVWNTPGDVDQYCDRTAETYQRTAQYVSTLDKNEHDIFSSLMGICHAFDVLPHGLCIVDLYPILQNYETIARKALIKAQDNGSIGQPDIPELLKVVPLESLEVIPGDGNEFIITMENVRQALENCLQDHQYAHTVCIEGSNFIIEMMPDLLPAGGSV